MNGDYGFKIMDFENRVYKRGDSQLFDIHNLLP